MRFKFVGLLLLVLGLSSCVTTEEKLFKNNVSVEKEIESRVQVAITYLQKDQADKAIFHLKEVLEKRPKSARAHEILALALEKNGELERSEKHFRKMLKYGKTYTRGRANFASFLMRRGEYEEAYDELLVVTDDIYYQNRAVAFQQLAKCAEMLGKYEEVEPAYQRAVALDNSLASAYIELAFIRFNNKDYAPAQKYFDLYREASVQSSARALLLGIRLARIFEDKSGEVSYVLALKNLYPKSAEYLEYIRTIRDK